MEIHTLDNAELMGLSLVAKALEALKAGIRCMLCIFLVHLLALVAPHVNNLTHFNNLTHVNNVTHVKNLKSQLVAHPLSSIYCIPLMVEN